MTQTISRKRFLQTSATVGGGLALSGPMSALAARKAKGAPGRAPGYGPIAPKRAVDTGKEHIALPDGFNYRVIARQGDPSQAFVSAGQAQTVPLPGIFDGTGAFDGGRGSTILVLNHENRQRPGEITVVVPESDRYDPDPVYNGGNTRLVVDPSRRVVDITHVLGGTSTNCAGGETPWKSWVTCEEIFTPASATAKKHGYCFEVDATRRTPTKAEPIRAAGAFSHEAVAYLDGVLYETEDRGDAGFYRYLPSPTPRRFGDLARSSGPLQAARRVGVPNFDANAAVMGETFTVDWVTIDDPDPAADTVRAQAQAQGAIVFSRLEGCWIGGGKVFFDSTSGGPAGLGQLWELDPATDKLTLVYVGTDATDLQSPDNLVYVPLTGDIFLQEDGEDEQFVRGVTQDGRIYDFAQTVLNDTEFCGGCFAPDGKTFFVSQQGGRGITDPALIDGEGAVMYAIWGPFARAKGKGKG